MRRPFFHLWIGLILGISLQRFGLSLEFFGFGALFIFCARSPVILFLGMVLGLCRGSFEFEISFPLISETINEVRGIVAGFLFSREFPLQTALRFALVLGDGDYLPKDIWKDFRELGLAHLLVISGSHIAVMAGFSFAVARRLPLLRSHVVLCRVLVSMIVLLFALLCSGGIPVFRAAAAFALVWVVGYIVPKLNRYSSVDRLSLLGSIFAVLYPKDLSSAAYALTFGASLSLLWLAESKARAFEFLIFPTLFVAPIGQIFHLKMGFLAPFANAVGIPLFEFVIAPLSLVGLLWAQGEGLIEAILSNLLMWIHHWALFSEDVFAAAPASRRMSLCIVVASLLIVLRIKPNLRSRVLLWGMLFVYHLYETRL